jgi:Spy/CpxP family protein refolding chaperone
MHRARTTRNTTRNSLVGYVALAALAAGASFACGCGSSSSSGAPASSASGTQVVSAAAGTEVGEDAEGGKLVEHHRHHHGGIAMFLHMSLDSLGVSDEQRAAVTKIQDDLSAKLEPLHAAQAKVLLLLADGVAAGNVDKAKVDAAIADVESSSTAAHAAASDALNQLHTVLTPPQRVALVQKLEAHWQVWQQANAEEEEQAVPANATHEKGGRFAALTRDLALTPEQVEHIRAGLRGGGAAASAGPTPSKKLDPVEIEGHMKTFGTAFEGDTFDAKTLSTSEGENAHLATHGTRRMARFYEAAAPVLTADQRTKLAATLREHAGQEAGK